MATNIWQKLLSDLKQMNSKLSKKNIKQQLLLKHGSLDASYIVLTNNDFILLVTNALIYACIFFRFFFYMLLLFFAFFVYMCVSVSESYAKFTTLFYQHYLVSNPKKPNGLFRIIKKTMKTK